MLRVSSEEGSRRRENSVEIYRQLGRSLHDLLQQASDRIFDAISEKRSRASLDFSQDSDGKAKLLLDDVSEIFIDANAKVDAISRSRQPLIVKSPSRYPSGCITEEDFSPLFHYKDERVGDRFLTKVSVNGGLYREFGQDGTLELYQFFSEENIECPSKGQQSKAKIGLDVNTSLEDLLEAPKFGRSSLPSKNIDAGDVPLDPKKQRPPPVPPSLLRHNIPSLRKSEDSQSAASAKPPHDMKLSDTLPELNHPKKEQPF